MKKTIDYIVLILSIIAIAVGVFRYDKTRQPYIHYKVYLDGKLVGNIGSKKELQKYINSQAKTIRINVGNYQKKLDAIETFNKYNDKTDMSKKDAAKYILENFKNYKLTDLERDNINNYINKKLYNVTYNEVQQMNEYVDRNNIYTYSNEVYTPNGIKIEKSYTYDPNIESVKEIYKKIIEKKSCTIAGYKFTIKLDDKGEKTLTRYI